MLKLIDSNCSVLKRSQVNITQIGSNIWIVIICFGLTMEESKIKKE